MNMYGEEEIPLSVLNFDLAVPPPAPRPRPSDRRGSAWTVERKCAVALLVLLLVAILGELFFVWLMQVISEFSGLNF